ncbi:hypothetical protein BJ508DRAFT_307926 [Ascobolus immersus RN42]|uniref:Ecp2 effector protein domain-containing protein n=1 Tax=Ascobolus immersus RN42 TaxID=1160509 RepID=A0A3N4I127_ASCIM|nr:hypothetical protein BJ508DRAFT_307926 [Ascobolus immersus RN42]
MLVRAAIRFLIPILFILINSAFGASYEPGITQHNDIQLTDQMELPNAFPDLDNATVIDSPASHYVVICVPTVYKLSHPGYVDLVVKSPGHKNARVSRAWTSKSKRVAAAVEISGSVDTVYMCSFRRDDRWKPNASEYKKADGQLDIGCGKENPGMAYRRDTRVAYGRARFTPNWDPSSIRSSFSSWNPDEPSGGSVCGNWDDNATFYACVFIRLSKRSNSTKMSTLCTEVSHMLCHGPFDCKELPFVGPFQLSTSSSHCNRANHNNNTDETPFSASKRDEIRRASHFCYLRTTANEDGRVYLAGSSHDARLVNHHDTSVPLFVEYPTRSTGRLELLVSSTTATDIPLPSSIPTMLPLSFLSISRLLFLFVALSALIHAAPTTSPIRFDPHPCQFRARDKPINNDTVCFTDRGEPSITTTGYTHLTQNLFRHGFKRPIASSELIRKAETNTTLHHSTLLAYRTSPLNETSLEWDVVFKCAFGSDTWEAENWFDGFGGFIMEHADAILNRTCGETGTGFTRVGKSGLLYGRAHFGQLEWGFLEKWFKGGESLHGTGVDMCKGYGSFLWTKVA